MWTWATRPWGRAIAVITTVVVGTTPGLAIGATAQQLSAGGGGTADITIAQIGPRDIQLTNSGTADLAFAGAKLKRTARLLGLDAASSCFAVKTLAPGVSCGLRLRASAPTSQGSAVRLVKAPDKTITLANAGQAELQLPGGSFGSLLRALGLRGGTCPTTAVLAPAASCTLRAGSTPLTARSARSALSKDRLPTFAKSQQQVAFEFFAVIVAVGAVVLYATWMFFAFACLLGACS
ncbi:MAG: hypothetical protein JHC84_01795 [Solirubrobacteraceae bacterium]|nr:hypothetical protein [Solirubrobacteraceae bacterium]